GPPAARRPRAAPPADVASPAPITSPTPVPTLEGAAYGDALKQLLDRNSMTEADFRARLQEGLLHDNVQKAIGLEKVPANQEQVHARHILVATEDQAKDVLQQLQGGADFAQLAQQQSTDPGSNDKGGDLG